MKVWVIATATYREAIRQPVFLILTGVFGLLIASCPAFALFTFGQDNKMIVDLSLGSLLICGLFVTLFTASTALADEIENKTVLSVLSKPVRREAFLLGKFVGILLAVGLALILLTAVMLVMLRLQRPDLTAAFAWVSVVAIVAACVWFAVGALSYGVPPLRMLAIAAGVCGGAAMLILTWVGGGSWEWRMLGGLVQTFFHLSVIAAISLAVSTRLGLVPNMLISLTVFFLGHASNFLFGGRPEFHLRVLYALVPNFENFNYTDALAAGRTLDAAAIGWSGLYALVYSLFSILLAMSLFSNREIM